MKPDSYQAWYFRAIALDELEQGEEAISSYDKALEFNLHLYFAWYYRAMFLDELERGEEAIASYDKALEIKPDFYQAWYFRSVALNALETQPDSHNAGHSYGNILDYLGRYGEASDCPAPQINPTIAALGMMMGWWFSEIGIGVRRRSPAMTKCWKRSLTFIKLGILVEIL
ncbi:MAG: tetratricopeptide repeat protein [Cyanobacteria bacterium P01_C01_bin.89]